MRQQDDTDGSPDNPKRWKVRGSRDGVDWAERPDEAEWPITSESITGLCLIGWVPGTHQVDGDKLLNQHCCRTTAT